MAVEEGVEYRQSYFEFAVIKYFLAANFLTERVADEAIQSVVSFDSLDGRPTEIQ